ncbi:hypothetical protein V1508DRAFT_417076 [Lipomyces doorenjongii]|uniref:uncharacterized protein n=1 Tax=Lipomyces doorenjongii TaxID=383834 RepID=UPI0034CD6CEA
MTALLLQNQSFTEQQIHNMTRSITTNITISAPPSKVHAVFLDFSAHSEWNPFMVSIAVHKPPGATPDPGTQLKITLKLESGMTSVMYPIVLENSKELFRWKGKLMFGLLFAGEHSFEFLPFTGDDGTTQTRFVQAETFGGVLVPLFGGILKQTEKSFKLLNQALKQRVEGMQ